MSIQKHAMPDWRAVLALRRLLRRGEVDLIHSHNGRTLLLACIAVALAGRGRCVATQHFLTPSRVGRSGLTGLVSRMLHRWVARHTAHTIMISNAVRDAALARGDTTPGQCSVIPNGVREPMLVRTRSPGCYRTELQIPDESPLIVCAARLEPEKDVATLVRAMAAIATQHPTVHCIVAGRGRMDVELRALIESLGVKKTVRLLGFRQDVHQLIAAADVFVLPAAAEPFGLVLIEAMALAKPVIAIGAGGPLEIVDDGITGLLVPPRDPAATGKAIARLIEDPALRLRMGQCGRARFEQRFTAAQMAAATWAVYRCVSGLSDDGESCRGKPVVNAACESPPTTASE